MSSASSTVRYPDTNSPEAMTRRAWWLVVLNVLIPGSPQLIAGNRGLGRFGVRATFVLWALAAIALLLYFLNRTVFITIATNSVALWIIQALVIFYVVLWVVLTLDTLRLVRLVKVSEKARAFVAGFSVVMLAALTISGGYGLMVAGVTRTTVGEVFAGTIIEEPIDGRYNILLLGGDAGPDRDGLRPDSISVVSVEAATGRATIIGIPRNLENFPFTADSPMTALYPNGYGYDGCEVDVCLINSIYTEVELYEADLYPNAAAEGSSAGIEAMRDAVEGVLGIQLQYYVLIDMQGFAELIDSLGGVTITVASRLPITDEVDENGQPYTEVPWIEPGVQLMDGGTALAYARIRAGTTDYDRMARQRQVQEAILQQFDPANVLTKFQAVAQAGARVVATDIPQSMLGYFVELAGKSREFEISKLEIVPPLIDVEFPDIAYIQQLTAEEMVLSTPEPGDGN